MSYTRHFVSLGCEAAGYGYKGRSPMGRCVLESRQGTGKLSLWAQDLKAETLYKVYLIFREGAACKGVPLCSLAVKENGKGQVHSGFDPGDIEGLGFTLDDCAAVAVVADNATETISPLCGYRQESFPWRRNFRDMVKERDAVEIAPAEAPPAIEEVEEAEEAEEAEESQTGEPQKEEPPEPIPPLHENRLDFAFREKFEKEANALIENYMPLYPFRQESREINWVRMSLHEDLTLPDFVCDLLNEAFVVSAFEQYGHLLLGKTVNEGPQRYYIGIPALYDPADRLVGFRQFKGCEEDTAQLGDYGYWLIFVA